MWEMSSQAGSVGDGSNTGGGGVVPLAVLLRREVASKRTASERPELHMGLFSHAKKGEHFTFLKPEFPGGGGRGCPCGNHG